MIPTGQIRIITQATNPPKPIGFGVLADGQQVAVLLIDDVLKAVEQYKAMQAAHERKKPPQSEDHGGKSHLGS